MNKENICVSFGVLSGFTLGILIPFSISVITGIVLDICWFPLIILSAIPFAFSGGLIVKIILL